MLPFRPVEQHKQQRLSDRAYSAGSVVDRAPDQLVHSAERVPCRRLVPDLSDGGQEDPVAGICTFRQLLHALGAYVIPVALVLLDVYARNCGLNSDFGLNSSYIFYSLLQYILEWAVLVVVLRVP